MKLTFFTQQTAPKSSFGRGNKQPRISFGKNGAIVINAPGCELIGLNDGDKISIAQDEEEPANWYVFKDKADGFEIRATTDKKNCVFNHKGLSDLFKNSMDLDTSKTHAFMIDGEPTTINKVKLWGILIPA